MRRRCLSGDLRAPLGADLVAPPANLPHPHPHYEPFPPRRPRPQSRPASSISSGVSPLSSIGAPSRPVDGAAERVTRLLKRWLPRPRLVHPDTEVQLDARHPRKEQDAGIPPVRISAGGASREALLPRPAPHRRRETPWTGEVWPMLGFSFRAKAA